MESKSFSTAALASLSSGMLLCNFGDMHEAAEYLMGHPIWSHEFASKPMWDLMKSKLLEQHPGLPRDAEGVTDWQAFLAATCAALGESMTITKGGEHRSADPITTARAILGPDKPIIAMVTD